MSLQQIQKLSKALTKSLEDNEQLSTSFLATKLAKASELYPEDKTIGSILNIIERMEQNKPFIRRAELKSIYNNSYSNNTKFAQLFENELGKTEEQSSVTYATRDDSVNTDVPVGDQILANALESVFDKRIPVKLYSKDLGNKAQNSVYASLDSWNIRPNKISIDAGNDKFLVVKAEYETPKGISSCYVPVEIKNNKILESTVFMGNSGPEVLNHNNVKNHILSFAKSKINGNGILNILNSAASSNREISDTEVALIKLNALRQGKADFFEGAIVGQKLATAAVLDVQTPKYKDEFLFETTFTEPTTLAHYQFGNLSKLARSHIETQLTSFGYKNPQITIVKTDEKTIFFGVALNGKVAFTVPVKIENKKINKPNIFLYNGAVNSFNESGINSLFVNNEIDYKTAATVSSQFNLTSADLINNIKNAIAEKNIEKAEDALNVLAAKGDSKAYIFGFKAFKESLAGKQTEETKCKMVVKNAKVSEHPICGHTGLPIHKVYQDKHGDCRPMYRKSMDETYESVSFNNSKVFI